MFEFRIKDCTKPLVNTYPELAYDNDSIILYKPLLGATFCIILEAMMALFKKE